MNGNGLGDTQFSTQDDEVLQKPTVGGEEDEVTDPRLQWSVDTFEDVPVHPQKLIGLVRGGTGAADSSIASLPEKRSRECHCRSRQAGRGRARNGRGGRKGFPR